MLVADGGAERQARADVGRVDAGDLDAALVQCLDDQVGRDVFG
ncbi:hypothetical protein [Streptosporangium sp. NPDC051022]